MARGKGKYGPKSKILVVLKSAHQKFLENALSKLIFSKVENGTPYSSNNADSISTDLNNKATKYFQKQLCAVLYN